MNLKKFEARSMKEALEMVKTQLGPDAVILSAKEVSRGFGASKTIEITAAYSENILKQKEFVKSKMPDKLKEQFNLSSARDQKESIKKAMHEQMLKSQKMQIANAAPKIKPVVSTTTVINYSNNVARSNRKYIDIDADLNPQTVAPMSMLTEQAKNVWNNMDVQNLKTEIEQLKEIILGFKQIPQNFTQSHPGAEFGVNYALCNQFEKLITKGILPDIAADIILNVQENISAVDIKKANHVESWIARTILETTMVQTDLSKKYQIFLGPTASGKSTTMVKLANDLIRKKNKRVAIISTDTIKIGADDQMKIYSQMLNIPFVSIKSPADWAKVIPYLNHVDYVLVDFASLNLHNQEEIQYIQQMLPQVMNDTQTHLVLSVKMKDQDILDISQKYKIFNFDDLIFTGLDEVKQYGAIYNAIQKINKPLFGFGIGSKIPEDFELATIERVLDLILDITKKNQSMDISL